MFGDYGEVLVRLAESVVADRAVLALRLEEEETLFPGCGQCCRNLEYVFRRPRTEPAPD